MFDIGLFRAADSVCFGAESVVSDVTGDGDGIPMTTATQSWGGGCGRSGAQVSGVSTDVVLFSENGSLIHHYRVFGRSAAHTCLRGTFMNKLWVFTVRADAEAKWEAGRVPIKTTRLLLSSDSPAPLYRSIRPQGSVCKARRAVSPVIPEVSTRTASSTIVLSATSYAGTTTSYDPPVLKLHSVLYSGRPPTLPVLILLPRFADKNLCPVSVGGDSAISELPGC